MRVSNYRHVSNNWTFDNNPCGITIKLSCGVLAVNCSDWLDYFYHEEHEGHEDFIKPLYLTGKGDFSLIWYP